MLELPGAEHTPTAVQALLVRIAGLEPDPAQVRVVIETGHGLLVERLLDAGFTVLPVNPDLIARRRGPAGQPTTPRTPVWPARLAPDRHAGLRPLLPHRELAGQVRAIARDDEPAARDERRLLNRLPADLVSTFPAALQTAGDRLGGPTRLGLRQRWPTSQALGAASRQELLAFALASKHGWPERLADQVAAALAADHFTPRHALGRAKSDTIGLAATQLLAIGTQRRVRERRMGELLPGAPRHGRAKQPRQERPGRSVPGGKVELSVPGLGDRLAARAAGELGDHPQPFSSPNARQCSAGKAPVTRRSGNRELVVSTRQAGHPHPADAVQPWPVCSLVRSGWAREFSDQQRRRGKGHHAALPALGNRWLELLWHCPIRGQLHDQATHITNRNRAHGKAA